MEKVDKRRAKIYDYIRERISSGSSPTVREICSDLNISSTSTVHGDLKAMCAAKLIEMTDGLNRTIRVPGAPDTRVPIFSSFPAGAPALAAQNIERYISVSLPLKKGSELFALRMKDDGMMKAAILSGDIVVAQRADTAESGRIVVALIGGEANVRRLYKEDGRFRFQPENDGMRPVVADASEILGRVLCVQRFYD